MDPTAAKYIGAGIACIGMGGAIRILFDCCDEAPAWGAKRWQQPPTIGSGPKSASSGRAKPLTRACASNTLALAEFGLIVLRGLSFGPAQSRRQTQK